jgi:hypothetical protein
MKKGFISTSGTVPICHGSQTLTIITYQYVRIIRGESTELNNLRHVPHLKVVWILGYLVPVDDEDPVAQVVEILHHGKQMHARQPMRLTKKMLLVAMFRI